MGEDMDLEYGERKMKNKLCVIVEWQKKFENLERWNLDEVVELPAKIVKFVLDSTEKKMGKTTLELIHNVTGTPYKEIMENYNLLNGNEYSRYGYRVGYGEKPGWKVIYNRVKKNYGDMKNER